MPSTRLQLAEQPVHLRNFIQPASGRHCRGIEAHVVVDVLADNDPAGGCARHRAGSRAEIDGDHTDTMRVPSPGGKSLRRASHSRKRLSPGSGPTIHVISPAIDTPQKPLVRARSAVVDGSANMASGSN